MVLSPKQMLKALIERQAAIQTQVKEYAPTRAVFEDFLDAGQREDAGFFWPISPGARRSRFNWKNSATVENQDGLKIKVRAFTDPARFRFGCAAGDLQRALISIEVSLPETPSVHKELDLPPVWAILGEDPDFSHQEMDRLTEDLEEIVPLLRACLLLG